MSIKLEKPQICPNCHKLCSWFTGKICHNCYRRFIWKRELIKCKRCGRMLPNHAKGYCAGCYQYVFQLEKIKKHNRTRAHKIDLETYYKLTSKCVVCGFDKIVDLHHLDRNHDNKSENNLIGLCPTHHRMIHDNKFKKEIYQELKQKGFSIPSEIENKQTR